MYIFLPKSFGRRRENPFLVSRDDTGNHGNCKKLRQKIVSTLLVSFSLSAEDLGRSMDTHVSTARHPQTFFAPFALLLFSPWILLSTMPVNQSESRCGESKTKSLLNSLRFDQAEQKRQLDLTHFPSVMQVTGKLHTGDSYIFLHTMTSKR
jgi:hypothetical protein